MTTTVTLTLRAPLADPIDADCVRADRFGTLGEREIAALPVWLGRRQAALGDFFAVRGGHSTRVRVAGDVRLAGALGACMTGGELVIDGDAGARVAAGLAGGHVDVIGSTGDDAGTGMTGGSLRIRGSTGDRVGAGAPGASKGMTGGEIVVGGSAGRDAGARMRRGLLFIGRDAGDSVARAMIAGTVIVLGRAGRNPAFASKRGTLIAAGGVDIPVTYRFACSYEPPYVRLALTHLRRRYDLEIGQEVITGRYRRYCGDAGSPGKGEILEWLAE